MPPEGGASDTLQVGHLARERIDEAAGVLARAFAHEALFAYLLGADAPTRAAALLPFMRGMIRGHGSFAEVHAATLGGRLVGAAIRVPPGKFPMSVGNSLRLSRHALPGFLRMCLARPGGLRLVRAAGSLSRHHPRDKRYWYLAFVGIDPAFHRRGIASRLACMVLDRADAAGVGCYLDTMGEGTVKLYEKHGFEVLGETRPFEDGPVGYRMWREPRAGSGS